MIDLYLVRHGESEANARGIIVGHTDVLLSEKGEQQVVALTNFLLREDVSLDIIYSSPLLRAFNTITPYAQKKSLKIYTDIRLKEIFLGLKEEKPVGELFSNLFHENPFYYMDTGGHESYAVCVERVRGFMQEKIFSQKDSKILISSHAGVTRAIIAVLNNLTCEVPFIRIQNASFTHYRIDEQTLKVECLRFAYDMYLREENLI